MPHLRNAGRTGSARLELRTAAVAATVVGIILTFAAPASSGARGDQGAPIAAGEANVWAGRLAHAPLAFVRNAGQADGSVRFYARGRAYAISFKQREVVLAKLGSGRRGVAIGMRFVGANPHAQISAEHPLATTVSYLRGDRRSSFAGLRTFGQIVYRNLWPGIDLAFVGVGGKLKYAFTLRPGADPRAIRFAYDDVKTQALDRRGNLLLSTAIGVMRDARPIAYQATSPVRARFVLQRSHASKVVSFAVGTYDSRRPLVIDPGITYSTYLGGAAFDGGLAIAVDSAGSAYVTGRTESTNFPTTPGAFHVTTSGAGDVFVTKFSPSGSSVAYSTFLGGTSLDEGRGIAVDAGGNAYVTGYTDSANFPTTAGAFDRSYGGGRDGFALKFSPNGSTLVYSTFFGGSSTDKGLALAIDSSGTSYITGETNSASFPTTTGSFDPTWNGDFDAFVIALNSSGSPVYSTFLGGGGFDDGLAITVDGSRAAYVTGKASPGFPVTPGAFDVAQNGGYDAFVTKLDSTGSRLVYSTYLGGNAWDEGLGLAVDGTGNAFLTGNVQSPNFPTTSGAFDTQLGDSIDAFLTKVNPAGSGLVYSTYLGGSSWDEGDGLGIDSSGNAYVAGHLASTDFPTTANAADRTENGNVDAFLTKVSPNGSSLAYSTYLGSSGWDGGFGLAVDSAGAGYVTGFTGSSQFPTTSGAFDTTWNGGTDVFVTKIDTSTPGSSTFRVAAGADDGDVSVNNMGAGTAYPPAGAAAASSNRSSFGVRRAGPVAGGYEVRTGLLRFDTSSLPAGATITSASLRLYVVSRASVDGRNVVAEWDNGAVWPIDAGDYAATASNSASTGVAIGSLALNAVNTLSLQNLGSISRGGYTTLRLHVDGGQPTGENGAFFAAFENGTVSAPQLVVNYTL